MRILLVGEFSRLHNSLKEGLLKLGHEVVIVSNGDGFKNYPSDYSNRAFWCESKLGNLPRQLIYRITKFDISKIERGLRFYFLLKKLKGFDCVQLINEAPIQTTSKFELYLLKKLFKQNHKFFLLCSGVDYIILNHMLEKKERYSIMNPYFDGTKKIKEQYKWMFDFNSKTHIKIHKFLLKNINGIIASDLDYVNPLKDNPKFLGMIPNPVNISNVNSIENPTEGKIVIFLGINIGNSYSKGIHLFEEALEIIKQKYDDKVDVIVTRNIPYQDYIKQFNKAHIVLDQIYAYDQGYNALEAMAKGKVVFTGAEKEFEDYYNLTEKVAVNALPNVENLVTELSFLIENPNEIQAIGIRARAFVEKEHNYVKVAEKYLKAWEN
ncbi:glycosyltransferase [Flavobacterium sp.]|uniref:glycosyltransferase n=1 Tax=Flavobacterium sp. TaxID=239 RepID=UPI00261324F6|nr:glycosyltransferase [Flavobacterium sp.]